MVQSEFDERENVHHLKMSVSVNDSGKLITPLDECFRQRSFNSMSN